VHLDAAFAGVILAVGLPPLVINRAPWWGYALAAGISIPLTWRRQAPFAVGVVVGLAGIAYAQVPHLPQAMPYGVLVATYTLADRGRRWQRWATLAAAPLGVLGSTGSVPDALFSYQFPILLSLSAYGLGLAARTRRRYAEVLQDRARHLDRARRAEAARAAAAERERIARDMHDILAHAVSMMVVQAEAGPVVVRSDPTRAEAVFDAIADAGRSATIQLRHLLRETDDRGSPGSQPGIAAVADLATDVGRTGVAVTVTVDGAARPVPAGVDVAVYRIIQEALTNVVRHAGAATVSVRLTWKATELVIAVADDGGGRSATATPGRGLVGISERAAACGGTASAGAGPDGRGFTVSARLPVPNGVRSTTEVQR
jgi:signal transduction histidine kinase